MATTTLNIVQRLGGPALKTFCAVCLEWLISHDVALAGLNAWALAFLLFELLHNLMVITTPTQPRCIG